MKKLFLLSIALITSFGLMSQNVIFEDNFESYEDGFSLHGDVYKVWEGTATVVNATDAYEGSKYAASDATKNNWQIRRAVTLEEGKTYTLQIATKSQDAGKHFVNILPSDTYGTSKVECTNADWVLHTTTFTVVAGKTDITITVSSYPKKVISVDAIKLTEGVVTELSSKKQQAVTVSQSTDGNVTVTSPSEIKVVNVYSLSGKMVQKNNNIKKNHTSLTINNLQEGIYILSVIDASGIKTSKKIMKY